MGRIDEAPANAPVLRFDEGDAAAGADALYDAGPIGALRRRRQASRIEQEDVAGSRVRGGNQAMSGAEVSPERPGAAVSAESEASVVERPLDEGGALVGRSSIDAAPRPGC